MIIPALCSHFVIRVRDLTLAAFSRGFLLLIILLISGTGLADEPVDFSRFEATTLANGLIQPMELAVAPDGTVFFIELSGLVRSIDRATHSVAEVGKLTVTTEQENGLIGLALDPGFAENHWMYLQYSPPDFPGQHISRFTVKDGRLDLASEKVLLKYEEQRKECCHHAGSLHFGPRGELFIATGDNTHPHGDSQGYAPLDERPDRAPWDAQKSSANTRSYNGKILRIRPTPDGSYEIPDGNLFPADGSLGQPEIYVMGCRNPWRMSVDAKTGFVYWGEVGPDAGNDGPRGPRGYDEINQARQAGNFGWPYFIANNQPYADVSFADGAVGPLYDALAPENTSPNNTGERLLPAAQPAMLYYPYGSSPEFPELGTGGRTACAGPVFHFDESTGSSVQFPKAYDGALLIYEWTRHWIKVVHFDEQYQVRSIEPFMPEQTFVRPIDMSFGPDGALYVIEYGETWGVNTDARLIRIDYIRGNRPPIVMAAAGNNIGREPLQVVLSGEGTRDKDADDQLAYEWRLLNAQQPLAAARILSREKNATVEITEAGVYNAELTVTDSNGVRRSAAVPVVVGNARPDIRFAQPLPGDFFDPGEPIRYQVFVRDTEDGTNDDHEIDVNGAEVIDRDGPGRVSVNAMFAEGVIPVSQNDQDRTESGPPGMLRMKRSDCFNCHAVDQKRVGPPLLEIAGKYQGRSDALEASVQRVLKGSAGVWGKIPMIPHSQHTAEEVREMVEWVYSLKPAGLVRVFHGFAGEIPVSHEETARPGYFTLEASYVDRGAGVIPPLNASAVLYLRPRLIEAENADEVQGPQVLNSGSASGGKFAGAINHGHYLKLRQIRMDGIQSVKLRVASAGAGGAVEIRLGQPDGKLLASTEIEVNGDWEAWYEKSVPLEKTEGRHDLLIRFTHPAKASGLMNLDSVEFLRSSSDE